MTDEMGLYHAMLFISGLARNNVRKSHLREETCIT
jgi:hypothetical protein